jgi:acyl carrier protein phosphodiesterase
LNYLAHAYLSFGDPEILVGNLISDFIKGKKKYDYPAGIQQGIALHRAIDTYTDEHPVTREAKEVLRPVYRLYSGALVDVLYDHFLATDVKEFTKDSLFDFSQQVYVTLDRHIHWLPERFAGMLPYMKTQNWLFNYHTLLGTQKSLEGVVRRARYLSESNSAYQLFEQHYQLFGDCYRQFWKDLQPFARQQYEILRANNL